jgi:hypothetical protein
MDVPQDVLDMAAALQASADALTVSLAAEQTSADILAAATVKHQDDATAVTAARREVGQKLDAFVALLQSKYKVPADKVDAIRMHFRQHLYGRGANAQAAPFNLQTWLPLLVQILQLVATSPLVGA